MVKDALISEDGKYRYWLTRVWDSTRSLVVFIGLNPSTADATVDDPTIRRCIGFAKSWDMGGLVMMNLFAYRATDPKKLKRVADPVGCRNLDLINHFGTGKTVVCCWGADPMAKDWSKEILKIFNQPVFHLGLTKAGHPKHPLYLKKDLKPIPYERG